ncbi:uncharacterized protein THITE_2064808 [Thermothielavioides terrestris NRRL 8126]|uniref:Uncharacterized protein n=1 Tax=Thermothielavioides terrestris (strain ATCC 38088 / NRRL 8126) TaxID=578455 RepID=G2R466_THETT|nr:uncharacterized protein THITE_2064808 [Thermothielavioides terrestris NRRL 8126]AEO65208.1 hypothetical protein THITE_2064808 [Thermothielavioides terrestris NRRL 8126]
MLRQAGDLKTLRQQQQQQQQGSGSAGAKTTQTASAGGRLKRRFWKDVHVREVNGALEIHLDTRPLRHPTTKSIIRLPPSKPHLAHALALEWDSLTSASQATKQHMIPLTSLVCRALDLTADASLRPGVAQTLLRYLDTDSLLCFCPAPSPEESDDHDHDDPAQQLHERQRQAYAETAAYVTARLWPGVRVEPVLEGASIVPRQQAPGTREAVQDWILSLSGFELAGLERATLAGKSLLAAARLVAEWSEEGAAAAGPANGQAGVEEEKNRKRFGVEEAAQAVSLEVTWQTRQWGEVEDTHDVEKEDLRRQLGSVVLLVSGTRKGSESKSS